LLLREPSELLHDTLVEERHDRQPAAEHERARLREEDKDLKQHLLAADLETDDPPLDQPDGGDHGHPAEPRCQRLRAGRPRASEQDDEARDDEELGQLRFRPHGRDRKDAEHRPQQRITLVGRARQLVGCNGDDRDHRGADAVEERLHPPQAAEALVGNRDPHDHEERGHDECEAHRRRAQHAALEVAKGDRELRGERARHDLRERDAEPILVLVDPAPPLDEITVHEADQRHGPAEAEGAEIEEIADELGEARAGRGRRGRWGGHHNLLT
jgi:hypothetical protein